MWRQITLVIVLAIGLILLPIALIMLIMLILR
jgi:hypothetical protein